MSSTWFYAFQVYAYLGVTESFSFPPFFCWFVGRQLAIFVESLVAKYIFNLPKQSQLGVLHHAYRTTNTQFEFLKSAPLFQRLMEWGAYLIGALIRIRAPIKQK